MSHLTPEQEKLKEALQSFPDKNTPATLALKQWPEYNNLYQALCGLGDVRLKLHGCNKTILEYPGRFMNSPIYLLREGEYYLLGINPGGDPDIEKTPLCKEIYEWCKTPPNIDWDIDWDTAYQRTVEKLCSVFCIKLPELCFSNLYFCRSKAASLMPSVPKEKIGTFWSVHEAVLDIIKPKCIFVIGIGVFKKIYKLMCQHQNKDKRLTPHNDKKDYRDERCHCRVVNGKYQGRPLKLIGIPHPRYGYKSTSLEKVLNQIAGECHKFTANNS